MSRFMEIMPLSVHLPYDIDPGGNFAGAAYFYQKNRNGKWELDKDSSKYGENTLDYFGYSVAIYGNYAIVGAYNYDIVPGSGNNEGAVYFYQRNRNGKWELDKESTKYGENAGDLFGWSVAIYGNYAIVGANDSSAEKLISTLKRITGNG